MKFPEIGDIVTSDWAIEMCEHFKLDYLVSRIKYKPLQYTTWKFDGVSCLPDQLAALVVGVDMHSLTYDCALPHDLCYAYGDPGNEIERKRVDVKFHSDLLTKAKMNPVWAEVFYRAVRVGGIEQFQRSFTWGFANNNST